MTNNVTTGADRLAARRIIPAGLMDAGFSSLASFAIGLFAVRVFDPATLGAYALVFSAYLVATIFPKHLLFLPSEVAAVSFPSSRRLALLYDSLKMGTPVALLAALALPLWLLVAPDSAPGHVLFELTVTGMMITLLAPLQEHVRQMLHIAGVSWDAAAVSAVQFAGAVAGVLVLSGLDVADAWVPFGSLAIAQLLSLSTGLLLARRRFGDRNGAGNLRFWEVARSGRWLLLVGLLPPVSGYVGATIVSHLAGAEALGFAEAARVVAQPILVLATGLAMVLGPRLMEIASEGGGPRVGRLSGLFALLITGCGVGYLAVAGLGWSWSPLPVLLPNAYVVTGLVAAAVGANIVYGISLPYRYLLLGARRERSLTRVEAIGAVIGIAASASAGYTHSFAVSLGLLGASIARFFGYRRALPGLEAPLVQRLDDDDPAAETPLGRAAPAPTEPAARQHGSRAKR